jgi:hypothetical protein
MNLVNEWKAVATKAWSVRLAVASALFGATDVILPLITPATNAPRWLTAISVVCALGSAVVRVIQQENMKAPDA